MPEDLIPAEPASRALAPVEYLPELFKLAIQQGPQGVEALERLVALQAQVEARQAKRDFDAAMAQFKATCPPVVRKTENAQFKVTRAGTTTVRLYASLEDIDSAVRDPAARLGLSYRWTGMSVVDGKLSLSCVVSHSAGHSESSWATVPVESKAGCSDQQKAGTAMTYAMRYSLIQAFGLTSCDPDTDGNEEPEPITPEQVEQLEAIIGRCMDGTRSRFLAWQGVATMEELLARKFEECKSGLEAVLAAELKKKAGK